MLLIRSFSACTTPGKYTRFVPRSGQYPLGFRVAGVHAGLKGSATKYAYAPRDVGLLVADKSPSGSQMERVAASGVFTQNLFQAAPVIVSREALSAHKKGQGGIRSVAFNSGVANAVTGCAGMENARAMQRQVTELLRRERNDPVGDGFVLSTGVIGQQLPITKVYEGIQTAYSQLGSDHEAWMQCAEAMTTTDTFPKLVTRECRLPSSEVTYRIAGMAKGAGMIQPNMATMLTIVATDVAISDTCLQQATDHAVMRSFNCISVDGETSTNDSFVVLANGATPGSQLINDLFHSDYLAFRNALTGVSMDLAKLIVRDGEGATRLVTIHVIGAQDYQMATRIGKLIGNSLLVKTSLTGSTIKNFNWGRIISAIGNYMPNADAQTSRLAHTVQLAVSRSLKREGVVLIKQGQPVEHMNEAEKRVDAMMNRSTAEGEEEDEVVIKVDLGIGTETATLWSCDLSKEYVEINANYRT